MVRDSIRAFADGDCELARRLKFKDRELDDVIDKVIQRLTARASLESDVAGSCLDLIFIARALERIGDDSTSIAEDSFWRDQGDDIRHSYPPKKTELNKSSSSEPISEINRKPCVSLEECFGFRIFAGA
jgi:phosphate transport system protein